MRSKSAGTQIRELFGHGSNLVILLMLVTLAVAGYRQGVLNLAPWALLGIALLPGLEYSLHRFALHAPPFHRPRLYRLQRRLHYDHHRQPDRLDLLFLPIWMMLPLVTIAITLFRLLTGNWAIAGALLFGSLTGLLYYEWVHYRAHIPNAPRTPWGRWLKKYHSWHHFKNERYWYGVTSPLVDWLAGTYLPVERVPRSPTVSTLFEAPAGKGGKHGPV
jgi:hypothetical protein